MKNRFFCLLLCLISSFCFALNGDAYMQRFNAYVSYSESLPSITSADENFLQFIQGSNALSNKLRAKWLYELALKKDWLHYQQYYQPSQDISLVCYAQVAHYQIGNSEEVFNNFLNIWLTGESLPPACNMLFDLVLKDSRFKEEWIDARLVLALDKQNIKLAQYLLQKYKTPHQAETQHLLQIEKKPQNIVQLPIGGLNAEFYLYGLKHLLKIDMDKALHLWQKKLTSSQLNLTQKQDFLAQVALYKALRNHNDAPFWFQKVQTSHHSTLLMEWQIRFAIKQKNWTKVIQLIESLKEKNSPCWQYWLARAFEKEGKKSEAKAMYEPLATQRHYYGFLASMRLNKAPNFHNEPTVYNLKSLQPYQAFLTKVRMLYINKQQVQAARLLSDFLSELPKDEAATLVYWLSQQLQWHGRSVYLSDMESLSNQLSLRFPLVYQASVKNYAKKYNIEPELVYAIIRQESGFREEATSPAGARGLMQLMPATAKLISKTDKIVYFNPAQLFHYDKNIHLGVAYLKQLAKRFQHHPILMAAAYNAGPRQVVRWLDDKEPNEMDAWVETIPWQETRNYLKNVMAFYVVYQYRLDQKIKLSPLTSTL